MPFWNCLSFIHHVEPGFLTILNLYVGLNPSAFRG